MARGSHSCQGLSTAAVGLFDESFAPRRERNDNMMNMMFVSFVSFVCIFCLYLLLPKKAQPRLDPGSKTTLDMSERVADLCHPTPHVPSPVCKQRPSFVKVALRRIRKALGKWSSWTCSA